MGNRVVEIAGANSGKVADVCIDYLRQKSSRWAEKACVLDRDPYGNSNQDTKYVLDPKIYHEYLNFLDSADGLQDRIKGRKRFFPRAFSVTPLGRNLYELTFDDFKAGLLESASPTELRMLMEKDSFSYKAKNRLKELLSKVKGFKPPWPGFLSRFKT